ncbi:MAG TPA: hypothetical protein VII73_10630 [Caulobacteraceae bacterium]
MNPALLIGALSPRMWLGVAAAAAASLVLAFGGVQSLRLAHVKHQLVAERGLLDACKAGQARLKTDIARQNAAFQALGDAARRSTEAADRALAVARRSGAGEEARAASILAAREGGDGCTAADALILRSLGVERRR